MHPGGGKAHWRLPVCLERPRYQHTSIGGANYRILDIPRSEEPLNRAEWNQAAFESLTSGAVRGPPCATTREKPQRERIGGESDRSDGYSSFPSSDSDDATSDSNGETEPEMEIKMTEYEIEEEENALDASFLASCSASKEGKEWRAEVLMPFRLFRRLVGKGPSKGRLNKTLHVLGARAGRAKMPAERGGEVGVPLWGPTEKRVCLAVRKAQQLMAKMRSSAPVTHFISLPLATPDVISRFEVYKHLVLASGYQTIDETLFISKEKLHITLLVVRLLSATEVQAAADALKAASADIYDAVGTRTLRLHMKGNSCFSDDPSSVAVVFAPLYSR